MSSTGGSETVELGARAVPLEVQVNRRARRIILRVDAARGVVVLVLPSARSRREGVRFAASRSGWITARLAGLPQRVPFIAGAEIPLLGRPHRIVHRPGLRGFVEVAEDEIRVGGAAERLPHLVTSWLRVESRRLLQPRSLAVAAILGATVTRVSVRETRSRWGSCSRTGAISYSWRLILAPEPVLEYVVAHEVAHLREANHGPRFWRLVADLYPEHAAARRWLRAHGPELHRYG